MRYELEIPMRETGPHLAVSIGTALAIEVLGGHAVERSVEPESLKHPAELWINVRTLVRNLFSAQDKKVKEGAIAGEFLSTLEDEMRLITEYVRDVTAEQTKVVYYSCLHRNLQKQFPKAMLKSPTTPPQIAYAAIENSIVEHYSAVEDSPVVTFKDSLEPKFIHAWVLTNTSVDLLELSGFKYGWLLESHTGKLKNSIQLYTKLTGGSVMGNIPFNKLTLQVFGDKSNLFSPMPKAVKDAIKEVAAKNKWTPAHRLSKVKFDINGMSDRLGAKLLLDLLR